MPKGNCRSLPDEMPTCCPFSRNTLRRAGWVENSMPWRLFRSGCLLRPGTGAEAGLRRGPLQSGQRFGGARRSSRRRRLESELPVFIVGLPRSGTTLIEQILASHSRVFGAGEITLARDTMAALGGQRADSIEGLRKLDRETARRLASRHLEKLCALDPAALRIVDKLPDNYFSLEEGTSMRAETVISTRRSNGPAGGVAVFPSWRA